MFSSGRIPRARVTPGGPVYLVRRNPWSGVWWSVALPGLGHLRMGECLTGIILMSWEILVNSKAKINLAIFYTFAGQFELARSVIDYRWAIIYPLFYIFCMYDSYRICLRLNRMADLEQLQTQRYFGRMSLSAFGVHAMDRRGPGFAAFWSGMIPGLGQLLCERLVKALILMAWYLVVLTQSNMALSFFHLWMGDTATARAVVNYQWLLFWPSLWAFGVADAYGEAVEQNRVHEMSFRWRIRKVLANREHKEMHKRGNILGSANCSRTYANSEGEP